jgi:hypothetical protein
MRLSSRRKAENDLPRRFDSATVVRCELYKIGSYGEVTHRQRGLLGRTVAGGKRKAWRIHITDRKN